MAELLAAGEHIFSWDKTRFSERSVAHKKTVTT